MFSRSVTGAEITAYDWSDHPLGPPSSWPPALRIYVSQILASPESAYLVWGDERWFFHNDAYRPILGPRIEDAVGRTLSDLWRDAYEAVRPALEDALASKASRFTDMEIAMARHGEPERTWWTFSFTPLRDEHEVVRGVLCLTTETTQAVRAATELEASRVRLAELDERRRLAADLGEVGIWDVDLVTDEATFDPRMQRIKGTTRASMPVADTLASIHPADRPLLDAEMKRLLSGELPSMNLQYRSIGIDDGIERTIAVQGAVMRDASGQPVRMVGAARDVSERVAAETRQGILNGELSHRLKNTLAVVQAIVTQTLRTTTDNREASRVLAQRIQTLARAHDILIEGGRDAASVEVVVRSAVALHDGGGRIEMDGPEVKLGPKAAMTMALILHELSTNASKYGSLSVPDGIVSANWRVVRPAGDGKPNLVFTWAERNGPIVVTPAKKNFGTRLIEMGMTGRGLGETELDYASNGLICRMAAPLDVLMTEDEA